MSWMDARKREGWQATLIACSVLAMMPWPPCHWSAEAQSTNGAVTLVRETVVAAGGRIGGGNPMVIITAMGEPIGGSSANGSGAMRAGFPGGRVELPPGSRAIAVEGTVDEPVASVVVSAEGGSAARGGGNGVAATVAGMSFRADGITLREGSNTLTVTATDLAGNRATQTATVVLDTHPPSRPTVASPAPVTALLNYTLSGTKTPGTSIWINGVQQVSKNNDTTWSATVTLVEGDNELVIVAKDAAGNESTSATTTITLDTLPPVVTFQPPAKTNLTPFRFHGRVDDRRTTVTVNGVAAARDGRAFDISLPLTLGANTLRLVATSPNGYVTEADATVTLGTIPTIQRVQPPAAMKLYAGAATPISIQAADAEGDPIRYQVRLDGTPLGDWSPAPSASWTPTEREAGPHTLTAAARDEDGGERAQNVEVFVVRPPIQHP